MFPELGKLKNQVLCHSSSEHFYLDRVISGRHFTHVLQVIIPGETTLPTNLKTFIKPYYLLRQVKLANLLDFEFLSAFVKNGGLSVMTAYSPDKGSSMAVTTEGMLILNLRTELYHKLGLDGTDVNPLPRKRGYNIDLKKIEVNLRDSKFYPGSKIYDRVLECVKRCNLHYDILLQWAPPTPEISPFSPVKFLMNKVGDLEWKECNCRLNYQQYFNIDVPNGFDKNFFDWAGVVSAGGNVNMQDASTRRNLIVAQWAGFIPCASFQALALAVRRLVPEAPFVVVSSIAFQSDPTLLTSATFNNESTLTICFKDNPVSYAVYSCPPI